jgi:hypothetical protein
MAKPTFPVDGQLLKVLLRAGASLRNPDIRMPVLSSDADGFYLEMKVEADPSGEGEDEVTRRIPLENLSEEDWETLKTCYENVDFKVCIERGISNGLEKITDTSIKRLFMSLLTFLNPRLVSILIYLYREASYQSGGPRVHFETNALMEELGYTRSNNGSFPSNLRAQLNMDIVWMTRVELIFPKAEKFRRNQKKDRTEFVVKRLFTIEEFEVANGRTQNFDPNKAADYTSELPLAYTVSLGFVEGLGRDGDYVLFADSINLGQRVGGNARYDTRMRLLIYLANRLQWDKPQDGQFLVMSQQYVFKNLDLLGKNESRNKKLLWEAIEKLKSEGYILEAMELSEKKKATKICLKINSEMLRCVNKAGTKKSELLLETEGANG